MSVIAPGDFRVEIGHDGDGPLVTVTHVPTRQSRSARPRQGETCARVQNRLTGDLTLTFFAVDDYAFEVGRCVMDGKSGGFCTAKHLPSGRSKTVDTVTSPHLKRPQQAVIELLLDELWRDGLLPVKPQSEETP